MNRFEKFILDRIHLVFQGYLNPFFDILLVPQVEYWDEEEEQVQERVQEVVQEWVEEVVEMEIIYEVVHEIVQMEMVYEITRVKIQEGPVRQPVQGPVRQPVQGPVQQSVQGPVQQSVQGPVRQPVQGPVRQPVHSHTQKPNKKQEMVCAMEPARQPVQGPVQQSVQEPIQGLVLQLVQEPVQKYVQQSVQEPVRQPVQEPARQPVQQAAQGPAQLSVQQPVQQPVQQAAQEPVRQPVRQPVYSQTQKPNKKQEMVCAMEPVDERTELQLWLQEQSKFFWRDGIFEEIEKSDGDMRLVVGRVQSGKTIPICGIAIYNAIVRRKTSVIMVRNMIGDYKQLLLKFKKGNFKKWNVPILYAGDKNFLKLYSSFKNDQPSIIISLANKSQTSMLNNVLQHLEHFEHYDFDLLVDEIDELCYPNKGIPAFIEEFRILQKYRTTLYGITATPIDPMFLEQNLKTHNIYPLDTPEDYKGLSYIDFIPLREGFQYKLDRNERIPLDLRNFYIDIEREDMDCYQVDGDWFNHPKIVLHRDSSLVKNQKDMVKAFASDPMFNESWTVMMYNGEGVWIYSPDLVKIVTLDGGEEMRIDGVLGELVDESDYEGLGIWSFKNIPIGSALQFIRDWCPNGDPIENIVIFSGRLASRGINFVSNRDYRLHLTHQLLIPSKSASVSDLIQATRLCGRYRDNIPLKLYSFKSDLENLEKGDALNNEYIADCVERFDTIVSEWCKTKQVYHDQVPKRNLSKSISRRQLNITIRPDGYDTRLKEKEWGKANLFKNLKKALKENKQTKIVRIIYLLWNPYTQTFRSAPQEELIQRCELTNWTIYIRWSQEHTEYQLLSPCDGNWTINPELVDEISKILLQ